MNTEFQRTMAWLVFAFSLVILWDRWQVAHGGHALLPMFTPSVTVAAGQTDGPIVPPGGSNSSRAPSAADGPPALRAAPTLPADGPAAATGEVVRIETDLYRIDFDTQGAEMVRAELLKEETSADWKAEGLVGLITSGLFTRAPSKPTEHIVLLDRSPNRVYLAGSGLAAGAGGPALPNRRNARFALLPGPRTLGADQQELPVTFEAEANGVRLRKTFVFRRGHYDILVRHDVRNVGEQPVTPSLYLELERDSGETEGESRFSKTYTGPALYDEEDHYKEVSFEDIAKNEAFKAKSADNGWVGMVQHYFLSAWIPPAGQPRDFYTGAVNDKQFKIGTVLPLGQIAPGASVTQQDVLYVGPQDQLGLEKLAPGLDRVANYGSLDVLARPLFLLLGFLYRMVGNWGWAIVLLTILVKLALYPLAAAGFKSMARIKDLAPRMQALKEQFGDDKQRLQVATMELYKKEKINPVGGCLPIVVQIPVFIALYRVLLGSVEMRNSPWILWIHDLSSPDPWLVLPAIMMVTSWIQFKMQPTPPDPVQAKMMMIMPLVFGVMFFFFPSGLVLYYVLNNLLSMLQQWRINHTIARSKKVG